MLIRCRAIDPAGFQVAVADVAMHGDFIGPFPPGFKVKETVNLFASEPEAKVSCDIVRAD